MIDFQQQVSIFFMQIEYRTKQLKQCAEDKRTAIKVLGAELAKQYLRRITSITNARSFESLRTEPGKFHELSGDRLGQWSASLNANYRLIITPKEEPFTDESGHIDWAQSSEAVIVEITDYH